MSGGICWWCFLVTVASLLKHITSAIRSFALAFPWLILGFPLASPWLPLGFPLASPWLILGLPLVKIWQKKWHGWSRVAFGASIGWGVVSCSQRCWASPATPSSHSIPDDTLRNLCFFRLCLHHGRSPLVTAWHHTPAWAGLHHSFCPWLALALAWSVSLVQTRPSY